jgi:hypothetical protein
MDTDSQKFFEFVWILHKKSLMVRSSMVKMGSMSCTKKIKMIPTQKAIICILAAPRNIVLRMSGHVVRSTFTHHSTLSGRIVSGPCFFLPSLLSAAGNQISNKMQHWTCTECTVEIKQCDANQIKDGRHCKSSDF